MRKQDSSGDYTFGNGLQNFWINTPEAVAQAVQTSLLLWLGEWFLNIDEGTPYMESILGKHTQTQADLAFQDRILSVQGVSNIASYQSIVDSRSRTFSLTCTLNTIYGPTSLQISNYSLF